MWLEVLLAVMVVRYKWDWMNRIIMQLSENVLLKIIRQYLTLENLMGVQAAFVMGLFMKTANL